MCSRGGKRALTGRRDEVRRGLDLGIDPIDPHALSAFSIRLETVLAAGRAFIALQMAVSAREAAGAGSRRLARLGLSLGGRGVSHDDFRLVVAMMFLLLLLLVGYVGLLGCLHGEGDCAGHCGRCDGARIAWVTSRARERIARPEAQPRAGAPAPKTHQTATRERHAGRVQRGDW